VLRIRADLEHLLIHIESVYASYTIPATQMASFVVPEELLFTELAASQLAPICLTRPADAGHGALPSDYIKIMMVERSLHGSDEWREMRTAIKAEDNGAGLPPLSSRMRLTRKQPLS